MQKLLYENETKNLSNQQEAEELFDKIDEETVWQRCYTNELIAVGIDNVPIDIENVRQKLGASPIVSDESIVECMQRVNMGLKVPFENGYQGLPLGDTAFSSLVQRAGYGTSPALLNSSEKSTQSVMEPTLRAIVINNGLNCYKSRALVKITDEKVRAVLSGDEADYSPLPFSELNKTLKLGLNKQFNEVYFRNASVDHSLSQVTYIIKDNDINDEVKRVFVNSGFSMVNTFISVKLISSDIGLSGANIYPYLSSEQHSIMIGVPLSLTHKNKHTVNDFEINVGKIMAMFKEASEKLEQMQNVLVKHPSGCLLRLAKQIGLNKKFSCESAIEFEGVFGAAASQLDVFWELQDIFDKMCSDKLSETRKLQIQENIARVCFGNIIDYDIPFQWE